MKKGAAATVVCTVGTSLFSNLARLEPETATEDSIVQAFRTRDWGRVGQLLSELEPACRVCGAEINSNHSAVERGYAEAEPRLVILHSDTEDGRHTAEVLEAYYQSRGLQGVHPRQIDGLQDEEPRRFRTEGLRNLAKEVCRALLEYGVETAAINATGGYKAQVAVAVLLGQAMQVPVFYKHERFDEIIAFPPLPVALDIEVWLKHSGLLFELDRSRDPFPLREVEDDYEEVLEPLVERTDIDGGTYVELSPAGQVFHHAFKARFQRSAASLLPAEVSPEDKQEPHLEKAGWPGAHSEVEALLRAVTTEVPQVARCVTYYYSPDRASRSRFRLSAKGVEGVYSERGYTVKFRVESRARTQGEQLALVAELNRWLDDR